MRKFRGKRKDNGEWVYGSYIHCEIDGDTIKPFDSLTEHDVDPETVGQYTGLKDKSGKAIYEGDIVESGTLSFPGEYRDICVWSHESAGFMLESVEQPPTLEYLDSYTVTIIGNRSDNPELLNEQS
jgi:uncharacterized phage protein (TIGR01671 family)